MRASSETYQKVANRCSEFEPVHSSDSTSNSSGEHDRVSCQRCTHFNDKDEFCKLNIYDHVVQNHQIK